MSDLIRFHYYKRIEYNFHFVCFSFAVSLFHTFLGKSLSKAQIRTEVSWVRFSFWRISYNRIGEMRQERKASDVNKQVGDGECQRKDDNVILANVAFMAVNYKIDINNNKQTKSMRPLFSSPFRRTHPSHCFCHCRYLESEQKRNGCHIRATYTITWGRQKNISWHFSHPMCFRLCFCCCYCWFLASWSRLFITRLRDKCTHSNNDAIEWEREQNDENTTICRLFPERTETNLAPYRNIKFGFIVIHRDWLNMVGHLVRSCFGHRLKRITVYFDQHSIQTGCYTSRNYDGTQSFATTGHNRKIQ